MIAFSCDPTRISTRGKEAEMIINIEEARKTILPRKMLLLHLQSAVGFQIELWQVVDVLERLIPSDYDPLLWIEERGSQVSGTEEITMKDVDEYLRRLGIHAREGTPLRSEVFRWLRIGILYYLALDFMIGILKKRRHVDFDIRAWVSTAATHVHDSTEITLADVDEFLR